MKCIEGKIKNYSFFVKKCQFFVPKKNKNLPDTDFGPWTKKKETLKTQDEIKSMAIQYNYVNH